MCCGYGQPAGFKVTLTLNSSNSLNPSVYDWQPFITRSIVLSISPPAKLTFDRNNERKTSAQRRYPIITQLNTQSFRNTTPSTRIHSFVDSFSQHSHSHTNTYVFGFLINIISLPVADNYAHSSSTSTSYIHSRSKVQWNTRPRDGESSGTWEDQSKSSTSKKVEIDRPVWVAQARMRSP